MSRAALLLGIDGGGSHTLAWVGDQSGHVLGRARAGPANRRQVGLPGSLDALEHASAQALAGASAARRDVAAVSIGLAGVDRPGDRQGVEAWLRRRFPGRPACVVSDVEILLAAGCATGVGLAVVAGTGSIAFVRTASGSRSRVGGWGPTLGDEGSGYAVGLEALRTIARVADGLIPPTALTGAVLRSLRVRTAHDLIGRVYDPPLSRERIAALARIVNAEASAGDAAASAILRAAGRDLGEIACAAVRAAGWDGSVPAVFGGGLLVNAPVVVAELVASTVARGVELEEPKLVRHPVRGALVLAARALRDLSVEDGPAV